MNRAARSTLIHTFVCVLVLSGVASFGAASGASRAQTKSSSAAGAVMAPDKGKFRIVMNGQTLGTEDFEISLSEGKWVVRGTTQAHAPGGGDMKTTGELHLNADGTPVHYAWSTDAPKKISGTVDFDSGTAKTFTDFGGAHPYPEDFKFTSPRVIVLDNNLYEQYAVLARLYDWGAGGEQSFPVLIPQDITPGSIKVTADGAVGGLSVLVVKSADLEIHLFCDASHKLVRLEVPASKVVVERE
jgi:hypothetical protein